MENWFMKHKALLALGLAAAALTAQAQSSVTIYGFVDQAYGKNVGDPVKGIIDSAGSRLGFRGVEDLGGGLKANFELEMRFSPDTGQGSVPLFKGRSYVGLSGGFGAVKVGRWWSQAYLYGQFQADPFGNETIAANYGAVGCGQGCVGSFWNNNSVTYNFDAGGFSLGAQWAAKETTAPGVKDAYNVGMSYTVGGLWVGLGYENPGHANDAWTQATVSYDFGSAKVSAGFGSGRNTLDQKVENAVVGGSIAVGSGRVIASYEQHKVASTTVVQRAALGYQHILSKRTKLFTTVANDSKAATSKTGFDLGILHSF
jgi:predicted porin